MGISHLHDCSYGWNCSIFWRETKLTVQFEVGSTILVKVTKRNLQLMTVWVEVSCIGSKSSLFFYFERAAGRAFQIDNFISFTTKCAWLLPRKGLVAPAMHKTLVWLNFELSHTELQRSVLSLHNLMILFGMNTLFFSMRCKKSFHTWNSFQASTPVCYIHVAWNSWSPKRLLQEIYTTAGSEKILDVATRIVLTVLDQNAVSGWLALVYLSLSENWVKAIFQNVDIWCIACSLWNIPIDAVSIGKTKWFWWWFGKEGCWFTVRVVRY